MKASAVFAIVRDIVTLALGVFVVVFETVKVDTPSPFLLLVALALLGVPGGIGLLTLLRGKSETLGTPEQSSSSHSPSS